MIIELSDRTIYQDEDKNHHRLEGPAVIWKSGREEWYRHGILHREDGPAVIDSAGKFFWYSNGISCKFEKWCRLRKKTEEEKIILKLKYGC